MIGETDGCRENDTAPDILEKVSLNVTKDHTGSYQWIYEFSFWKNPAILITTFKLMLIAGSVPAVLMFFLSLEDGLGQALSICASVLGLCIGIITALMLLAYLLIGFLYGGKYYVLFKMDDQGINHIQLAKQVKKAQAMGYLTALIGLSSGNITAAGAGLMGASKQSLYTHFKKVKSVKIRPKRDTIYLNESVTHNQIYADKEDFQFIRDHILKHCAKDVRISDQ